VLADPGTDRAAAVSAVRDLPVSGKAALLDCVETVTQLADSILAKTAVRVAVFYLTDSDPENYREDFTNPVINSSDKGAGMYDGEGDLGSGGTWQVTVTATQNGQVIASKHLTLNATGGM